MKIKFYGYNTFIIESGDYKIAIDPGALFFYYFRLTSLIPEAEWKGITHIFLTHGDIDHHWHTDRVAKASNAPVICNKTMLKDINGEPLMLGPRDKGLAFTTSIERVRAISAHETIEMDGLSITGLKATHGPLTLKLGPIKKTIYPGPGERVGWGAIGFEIKLDGKTVVNLGDTLLLKEEWEGIQNPDVLMIPIGGKEAHNTMDEQEALQAIQIMRPKLVIPCHYNMPALFSKKNCPVDDKAFQIAVEKAGSQCVVMDMGESINLDDRINRDRYHSKNA